MIVNSRVSVLTITQLPSGMYIPCGKVVSSLTAVLQISEMAFLSFLNKEVTHSCLCPKSYTGLRRLQNVESVPTLRITFSQVLCLQLHILSVFCIYS